MLSSLTLLEFHIIVAVLIAVDLFVGMKRRHGMSLKESTIWSIVWIGFGVAFGVSLSYEYQASDVLDYFTIFVLEKSLSVDNLFVFAAIFSYFATPVTARPVVLYIGVISAIVMRALFIYAGIAALEALPWIVFIFAAILIYSGVKIWGNKMELTHVERNPIVRFAKRYLPIADRYDGNRFVLTKSPLLLSPLILVLFAIEASDLMFAVDSIPAALAISNDFTIVYTANIAAVLGLRSLYFLVDHLLFRFKYLNKGLGVVLALLGVKFLFEGFHIEIPKEVAVASTLSIIGASILLSIVSDRRNNSNR
ncbi:Inner membrane protein alx [archaeon HR04]|nr:Inner membrane protein alx [archaeon HR04]